MISNESGSGRICEVTRLEDLYSLNILDTKKEERFDRFIHLILNIFDVPIAFISLIDANRQWFKSAVGFQVQEIPRDVSFCAHTILEKKLLVVRDTAHDVIFSKNPFVQNPPYVRFYAGAILRGPKNQPIGTVSIIDHIPREFDKQSQEQLLQFARLIEHELRFNYCLKVAEQETVNSLYYEKTTRLPTPYLFKERLAQAIDTIEDHVHKNIAVIALVIDQLNELKNAFGLDVIKPVFNKLIRRIRLVLKKSEMFAYFEDNTFILFIFSNSDELLSRVEDICAASKFHQQVNHQRMLFSSMAGISIYPLDAKHSNKLIANAKYAVHLLTKQENIPYRFYSDDITKQSSQEYKLALLLANAVETKTIEVVYQPKVNISTGYICGVEALCRWNAPELGPISPTVFIPLAERSDLIILLGKEVLKQACWQNQQWQAQGFRKFPVSVNISRKQITETNFVKDIQQILKDAKLENQYLELEITESVLMKGDDILDVMNTCEKLGIAFSLDDFGTGFSSLSYLKRFPFTTLKIDISFIKNMLSNITDRKLVHAIISMSKALNIKCIAEGVEKQEQLELLRSLNCDEVQGYIYSPPLTVELFTQLLKEDRVLPIGEQP